MWRKLKPILPYHISCYLLALVVAILGGDGSMGYLLQQIPGFFLLQQSGLYDQASLLIVEWYLSALLIAVAILYPIARRWYHSFTHLFAPLGAILLLGYLYMQWGRLGGISGWNGIAYYSTLRALAELMLGMTCYELCLLLQKQSLTRVQRGMISVLEAGSYLYAGIYLCLNVDSGMDFLCLFALAVAVTLSFSQKGLLGNGRLFQNRFCHLLGALSLPIYLAQSPVQKFTLNVLKISRPRDGIALTFLLIMLLGIGSYLLVTACSSRRNRPVKGQNN